MTAEVGLSSLLENTETTSALTTVAFFEADLDDETETLLSIPVDSTIETLFVSVLSQSTDALDDVTVYRPDTTPVEATDLDVRITTLPSGRLMALSAPSPGTWQVGATGTAKATIKVTARSTIDFNRFAFVAMRGWEDLLRASP